MDGVELSTNGQKSECPTKKAGMAGLFAVQIETEKVPSGEVKSCPALLHCIALWSAEQARKAT